MTEVFGAMLTRQAAQSERLKLRMPRKVVKNSGT
jgi:hypothetical protein